MTKQALQQELKEKIKPGVKASDLKKLKRSKSDGDIPSAPPLPNSNKEDSVSAYKQSLSGGEQGSTAKQITQLQQQVKFHAETAANYLKSLQTSQAKVSELEEKLKDQSTSNSELDQALFARHKNLKDWFKKFQQTQKLDKELSESIDQASNELADQDETISTLRSELRKLKQTNQSLTKDLELAQRAVKWRQNPLSPNSDSYPFLKYTLYSLAVAVFTLWLVNNLKTN